MSYFYFQPYANCTLYLEEVRGGQALADEVNAYDTGSELLAVSIFRRRVWKFGIIY